MPETSNSRLIQDCIDAVWQDRYMWACLWAQPRRGKTTLAGDILHAIYTDIRHNEDKAWEDTLQAIIFNLEQCIHRLKFGIPCKQYTTNGLHNRVPGLNWDDFGAYSNKATTQHSEAWDDFKGGFDVLGTKVAVLLSTMVDPSEPTFQLNNKFTHEIQVTSVGNYKYDEITWQQDFRSNRIRIKKICIETGTFDKWPDWVYADYDKQRCSLADEVFQRIEDKISAASVGYVVKILKPTEIEVLRIIDRLGLANREVLNSKLPQEEFNSDVLVKLKSRNLIIPTRVSPTHYKYDLTQLGRDVLTELDVQRVKEAFVNPIIEKKISR